MKDPGRELDRSAKLRVDVLYYAILCHTILYYDAFLYYAILHYTTLLGCWVKGS